MRFLQTDKAIKKKNHFPTEDYEEYADIYLTINEKTRNNELPNFSSHILYIQPLGNFFLYKFVMLMDIAQICTNWTTMFCRTSN